jgi:DhnA family fructose-bisphosphate aldolase class Ia
MYGCIDPKPSQKVVGADLGLYSITFTNNLDEEHQALREFQEFRLEAERKGFRYFLEVFNPNVEPGISEAEIPAFVNDHIIRSLAGVTKCGRPLFLKIAYNGPKALSELVSYDPQLIVGILGGSAGTTYDAFKLISDAQKYGARVALFGRKINLSEHPLTFLEKLRQIVDHQISAEEAVKAYHDALQRLRIRPLRELAEDMKLTGTMMRYR